MYVCGSVMSRFYEGVFNAKFLTKIKSKVDEALEYYKEKEEKERKRIREEESDELRLQMEENKLENLPLMKVETFCYLFKFL